MTDKVTFNGDARVATVNVGVTTLDIRVDLYSAWVRWAALAGNSVFWEAFRRSGLDPVPGGFTGDIYFLYNNWKLVIDFRYVKVTGVLFSDNYETAYYTALLEPLYPPKVSAIVNTISTGGVSGLSDNQGTMLLEMYRLLGLDPTIPLVVNNNTNRRTAGAINQSINTSGNVTTVTRL